MKTVVKWTLFWLFLCVGAAFAICSLVSFRSYETALVVQTGDTKALRFAGAASMHNVERGSTNKLITVLVEGVEYHARYNAVFEEGTMNIYDDDLPVFTDARQVKVEAGRRLAIETMWHI